jgi:hypothetical protein
LLNNNPVFKVKNMTNQEHIDWAEIVTKLVNQKEEAIAKLDILLSDAKYYDCDSEICEGIYDVIEILKRYMK